jgi:succinate dehydrogenase / fumarate reductase cytochrome b subunit
MIAIRGFVGATAGQKALAAGSGLVCFGWLILHLGGNLTAFAGAGAMDGYAAGLRRWPALLWGVRALLGAAFLVHVVATLALARRARAARPDVHAARVRRTSFASRTLRVGGPLILVFVVFHVAHLTLGAFEPEFVAGHVYANLVAALHSAALAIVYSAAAALVGLHLFHGAGSAFVSLGSRSFTRPAARRRAAALAVAVALGFAAVPVAVASGVLR